MKTLCKTTILASALVAIASICAAEKYSTDDYRNYIGLGWIGNAQSAVAYANQMGYKHIMYMSGMEGVKGAEGLTFYIESPEHNTYEHRIDTTKTYTKKQIDEWEKNCTVVFPDKPFPQNMATGWFVTQTKFAAVLDMQQKRVHDITIERILKTVERIRKANPEFKFGGFTWDVPQPFGDFWPQMRPDGSRVGQVTLKHWTGADASPETAGKTHDYPTYTLGRLEFYKALRQAARAINPDAKFIVEPALIQRDWMRYMDSPELQKMGVQNYMADFVWQELGLINFLNEENFKSGLLSKSRVGSSTPDVFDEQGSRRIFVAAAMNGSWTAWFGRAGGSGNAPNMSTIADIPARLKLGKAIATWENLNNTPLEARKFDGEKYASPTAQMSANAYAALQPETNKLFFVFISERGEVEIPKGFKIDKIYHTNGLFIETDKVAKNMLTVEGGTIKPSGAYLVNLGFIAHLKKLEK